MRTMVVAILAMAVSAPLAAQNRDTVAVRRSAEAARAARADQARQRLTEREVERVMLEARPLMDSANRRLEEVRRQGDLIRLNGNAVALQGNLMRDRATAFAVQGKLAESQRDAFAMMMRPRLGITVALEARATDNIGAYVSGVTPNGPADKAGIRSGDIIRKIDKYSLTERDNVKRRDGESAPGFKLIEIAGKLEAGKAITVEYRRGTRNLETKLTPDDSEFNADMISSTNTFWRRGDEGELIARLAVPSVRFADSMRSTLHLTPPAGAMAPTTYGSGAAEYRLSTAPSGSFAYAFTSGGPLGRLELTSLNAGLGSYFGATEGVLVINVPESDNYGLMAGDVITAIDGRKVSSPSQLMRIMRTYEKDESPKLQIMRQKRAESISVKLP